MPCTQQEHLARVGGGDKKETSVLRADAENFRDTVFSLWVASGPVLPCPGFLGGVGASVHASCFLLYFLYFRMQWDFQCSRGVFLVSHVRLEVQGWGRGGRCNVTVLSWCLKDLSNSKRLELLRVQTVTEIGIIQSECVIAWTHAVLFFPHEFSCPLWPRWLTKHKSRSPIHCS